MLSQPTQHAVRATRAARAGQAVTPGSGAGAGVSGVSPDGALAPALKRQESQASYDWGSPRTQGARTCARDARRLRSARRV